MPKYLAGQPFNETEAKAAIAKGSGSSPAQDSRTSEDCLFLDVITPQKIFDRGKVSYKAFRSAKAPVLVWIHGGGYTTGEKTGFGLFNPTGLLKASQAAGSHGFVFVSINYRVRFSRKKQGKIVRKAFNHVTNSILVVGRIWMAIGSRSTS